MAKYTALVRMGNSAPYPMEVSAPDPYTAQRAMENMGAKCLGFPSSSSSYYGPETVTPSEPQSHQQVTNSHSENTYSGTGDNNDDGFTELLVWGVSAGVSLIGAFGMSLIKKRMNG